MSLTRERFRFWIWLLRTRSSSRSSLPFSRRSAARLVSSAARWSRISKENSPRFATAKYCVGVASGTDAVRFALMAAGVQPGDIVVTVPHTFIATTEGISQAGARPDFVDIDEQHLFNGRREAAGISRTGMLCGPRDGKPYHRKYRAPVTAVVPVHIYGQMRRHGSDPRAGAAATT